MKKKFQLTSLVLFFLLSICSLSVFAAGFQIDDSSFEDWSDSFNGQPALGHPWNGANVKQDVPILGAVYGQVVYQTTEAHSGKYAAKLIDTEVGAVGIVETSPAWVTLGTPWAYLNGVDSNTATAGTDGGIDFTHRPDTMAVWIKRHSVNEVNKENINLVFYSWKGTAKGSKYKSKNGGCTETSHTNEESDIRRIDDPNSCGTDQLATQIGEGWFQTANVYPDWTQIKVPIKYYDSQVPEKMNIILSASNYPEGRRNDGLVAGNYMIVDDISFIYSSKISDISYDDMPIMGFDPNKYEYVVELPEDATDASIPKAKDIVVKRSGRVLGENEYTLQRATALGEPCVFTVRAEDGSSESTYYVTFVRKLSTNSLAKNIFLNGVAVPGFAPAYNTYDVTVPYGTTSAPEITIEKGHEGQTYEVVTCNDFPCQATVKVYAENKEYSTTYNLNISVAPLSDNTLQDILINGESLVGFNPTTNAYTVEMPLGTTEDPTIEAVSKYEPGMQQIVITNNGLNGKSTIEVTPPAGQPRTYRISYVITESTYSYLNDLKVGGETLPDFAPDKLQYAVSLPLGTTELPEITWEAGDAYQTITRTDEGVNGTTRIAVVAQSGKTSTYRIAFSVQKSEVKTLANIFVDGVALEGFDPNELNYSYNVAASATSRPVVTWEAGDAYQTVTKNPASEVSVAIEGVTKLTVKAQNGAVNVYSIQFTQTLSDNAKLADLSVAGYELSPAFDANVANYTCSLNRGTTAVPAITYVKGDPTQVVRIDENGVNGVAKITVKAQTGTTMVYSIAFSVATSSDVTLKNILVGGEALADFDPAVLLYNVTLPAGTTEQPAVEAVKNDEAQRVIIARGGVNGTTTIRVIAENGAEQTYSLQFSVEKSLNATLKGLYVDGVLLPDFDPNELNYRYVLADDVMQCPVVTAEGYAGQTITILTPQLLGTARIDVQPEDGAKNVYTILFTRNLSNNNLLNDIQVNGASIDGFDPATNSYAVELPVGTTQPAVVTYTKGADDQNVLVTHGGLTGATTLEVMAADGSVNVYTIQFTVAQSDAASLQAIYLDGMLLDGFDPAVLNYSYQLAQDATTLPVVTYTKASAGQRVSLVLPALEGNATLAVVSEDGSQTQTYTIAFAKALSNNATLNNILVNGVGIDGFASDQNSYEIDWMNGTELPTFTYEKAEATQRVVVKNEKWAGCTFVVTAQDGTTATYTVSYNKLANNVALLSDIQLYNANTLAYESVAGFDATVLEYSINLPWRTAMLPAIQPVAGAKGQRITITEGGVDGTTTIHVLAQDDTTEQTYLLHFATAKSNDATLSNIIVNGKDLEGFAADVLAYTIPLEYGSAYPAIEYEKAQKDGKYITEQQVIVSERGLYAPTTLLVVAQDGVTAQTYTLNFAVAPIGKANTATILLDGEAMSLEEGVFNYNIALAEGVTALPELAVEKNYNDQEVRIAKGNNAYTVTLVSNQAGVEDVTYTIAFQPYQPAPVVSNAYLTAINVASTATLYPAFDPAVTKYVAVVKNASDITFAVDESVNSLAATAVTNKKVVQVTNKANSADSRTYTVYLHYADDVIPNGDFSNWTTAKNNSAAKPVSWQVPADAVAKYSGLGSYTTGSEVKNAGSGIVQLNTCYAQWGIGGSVPGMMTLGSIAMTFKSANGSTSSVSGGISFRNSPDYVDCRYQYASSNNINNIRIVYTLTDENGTTYAPAAYTDASTGDWKDAHIRVTNDGVSVPKTLNLIVNAGHSENCKDLGGSFAKEASSTMYVDYVRFAYSSTITGVTVNGVAATQNGKEFAVTVPNDAVGIPQLGITGEVEDQAYQVTWGEEVNAVRKANIRSYAEDGSYTDYTVTVTREISSKLALLQVGRELLDVNITSHTLTRLASEDQLPDVRVETAYPSASAVITTATDAATGVVSIVVTVTSELGEQVYNVALPQEYQSDATLKNLQVAGYELTYSPDVFAYEVVLPADATLPAVSYEKQMDGQTVVLTPADTTTLVVTSKDNSATNTYKVVFSYATTALLNKLAVLNAQAIAFDTNTFEYNTTLNADEFAVLFYEKACALDVLSSVQTDSEATFTMLDKTYRITYAPAVSSNALLQNILVNGVAIEEFDALVEDYDVPVALGQVADIEPVLAEEGQTVEVVFDAATQRYTITVTAQDATTTQNYTVDLLQPVDNNANLAAIYVNDALLPGFNKETLTYSYEVACDMPKWAAPTMPCISAVGEAEGQTISIESNGVNGKAYIIVVAADGKTEKVYEIDFTEQLSAYAYLNGLSVNYVSVPAFEPTVTTGYTVELPAGAAAPEIGYELGDAYQQVAVTVANKQATLVVTAQNGDQVTYTIDFTSEYTHDAHLDGITLDGVLLDGFASDNYDYTVVLPVGTTTLPAIGVVSGADAQTVEIVTNGVNGDAVITVTADDAETQLTYTIHFSVELSQVATLLDIQLDGESLPGFDANNFDYTVAVDKREWPLVTWTAGDQYQTVTASEVLSETDLVYTKVVSLLATAQDAAYFNTYNVTLNIEKSGVDTLKAILLDDVAMEEFAAEKLHYVVELPVRTAAYPTVSYVAGDAYQNVAIEAMENGVKLVVTAENGSTRTYEVIFVILRDHNASLASLMVNYEEVMNFDPATLEYSYELPYGTTELPAVTYEVANQWQVITETANGVHGDYFIEVTAEDGVTQQTYVIHFSVAKSDNAHLSNILVAGESLEGFDAETYEYTVTLPYGETVVPAVEGVKAMDSQTVEVENATSVADTTIITVTAEDGITQQRYIVTWENALSTNAKLQMIYLDGVALEGFEAGVDNYTVVLPYGTTELPAVTYLPGDADQVVTMEQKGMTVILLVEAQDGKTTFEYTLHFEVEKSNETRLKNIFIKGVALPGFVPEEREYDYVYPNGTPEAEVATIEDVTYEVFDPVQKVTLLDNGMVLMLRVTAENGDISTYTITQSIALSNNTALDDILVNGKSLAGFDPEVLDYTYILPYGSVVAPSNITYVSSDSTQTVAVVVNPLSKPSEIFVIAEDGTTAVYRIYFLVDEFDPASTPTTENVCVTKTASGDWKFTTNCNNVFLYMTTLTGQLIKQVPLPLVDVNVPDICSEEAEGYLYSDHGEHIVTYYFVHMQKTVVKGGKIRVTQGY